MDSQTAAIREALDELKSVADRALSGRTCQFGSFGSFTGREVQYGYDELKRYAELAHAALAALEQVEEAQIIVDAATSDEARAASNPPPLVYAPDVVREARRAALLEGAKVAGEHYGEHIAVGQPSDDGCDVSECGDVIAKRLRALADEAKP